MRCVILGGGALGTILAAHLRSAGHEVVLIARGDRARWLHENGLRVTGLAELSERCEICTEPQTLRGADLFINTVKTYDTRVALNSVAMLAPAVALSVQNGVMKEAELVRTFGPGCVLGAMADFSGELAADGGVAFTRNICLQLGELGTGLSPRAAQTAALLQAAGIIARASEAIDSVIWSKFVGWVALMLIAVLTRRPTAEFLSDPDAARVVAEITREMARLAKAKAIELRDQSPLPVLSIASADEDAAVAIVQEIGATFTRQAPQHRMSALQDLLRARALELEETAGFALASAHELGLEMPVTALCYRLAATVNRASLATPARA